MFVNKNTEKKMMIFERNELNATKGNNNYLAKQVVSLQPKRAAFGRMIIREDA